MKHAGFPGCYFYAFSSRRKRTGETKLFKCNALGLGEWSGAGRRNKMSNKTKRFFKQRMPLNLQFFAEGGTGNDGGGNDGGGAGNNGNNLTFDEWLASGHQAEFERRVQKAVNTAVTNAQEKWKVLTDDKVSEAEKLAKMTAQEKSEYLQNKREKELEEREKKVARDELMAEAKNTLSGKNLPLELAEVLDYTDADSCNKSITMVEKAFQKAVETAVEERLKGEAPPRKSSATDKSGTGAAGFVSIIKENQSKR